MFIWFLIKKFILLSFSIFLLVASYLSYCVIFSHLIDSNFLDKTSGNEIIIFVSKVFLFCIFVNHRDLFLNKIYIIEFFSLSFFFASYLSYCVIFSDLIDSNLLDKTSGNDIIITVSKVFHFCIFVNHRDLILKHSTQIVNLI